MVSNDYVTDCSRIGWQSVSSTTKVSRSLADLLVLLDAGHDLRHRVFALSIVV
jgi:hypothetical protein